MGLSKKYKDLIPYYSYRVHWSDDDSAFIVTVEELSGCVTHGETHKNALDMAFDAVEGYLEVLEERELAIPEPLSKIKASGTFIVRSEPAFHQKLIQKSREAGFKTLNKYVLAMLNEEINGGK